MPLPPAAAGKLMDLAGSRAAMEQFGLSRPVARVVGGLLPLVEAALAVALFLDGSSRLAAIAAAALLAVFMLGIGRGLARG